MKSSLRFLKRAEFFTIGLGLGDGWDGMGWMGVSRKVVG